MTAHLKRWLTAVLVLPLVIVIVLYGGSETFALFVGVVAALAFWEYVQIALRGEKIYFIFGLLATAAIMGAAHGENFFSLTAVLVATVIILFCFFLRQAQRFPFAFDDLARLCLGVFYVSLGLAHLVLLRKLPEGTVWVFFVLIVGFAGDTFGYYGGKFWGKHPLFPAVSPAKTVEGLLALLGGSLLFAWLYAEIFLPRLGWGHIFSLAILGGILGQLGDLSESAIKRTSGVKDSGSLLPGHGGFLDRLDCFLFLAPFFYYYRVLVLS